MIETAARKLPTARSKRKLTLDDASRATKIRSRQLADLERDEYSNFPNLAYAKGFLISYGKYLDVDVRPYLDAFEDSNTFGLDNYQYLSEVPLGVYRATRRPTRRKTGRGHYIVLAGLLGSLALAFIGWQLYIGYERLGDLDKLADHQDALEHGPQPAPAPATGPSDAAGAAAAPVPAVGDPAPPFISFPGAEWDGPVRNGPPTLPLPDDGGAIRQLLAGADESRGPLLFGGDAAPRTPSGGRTVAARPTWSPENLDGYRFYVRSLDRNSVEIFRISVSRPETVLNNPL